MSKRIFPVRHCVPLLAPGALLAGCVDDGTLPVVEPSVATEVTISPPAATLAALGATTAFTARITDQNGVSFPGTVTWASGDPAVFTVSSGGEVTAVGNGRAEVSASYQSLAAMAEVVVAQAPAAVTAVAGTGQEGLPGRALPDPVVVRVDDAGGTAVAGTEVRFAPSEGHGSADPGMAATDSGGLAATSWTLGSASGLQTLVATAAEGVQLEVQALAGEVEPPADTARYDIFFRATWSAATHPAEFPPGPHFSPLIGAVHSERAVFWALGDTASEGIEQMAETGATGRLASEIRARIPDDALAVISGRGTGSPDSTTIRGVGFARDQPRLTLVTMIAPSPDWFAGVAGLSLQDDFGQWRDRVEVVLHPLDAGTDDGPSYRSPNADTRPRQPIRRLRGTAPFSDAPVGVLILTRQGTGGGR